MSSSSRKMSNDSTFEASFIEKTETSWSTARIPRSRTFGKKIDRNNPVKRRVKNEESLNWLPEEPHVSPTFSNADVRFDSTKSPTNNSMSDLPTRSVLDAPFALCPLSPPDTFKRSVSLEISSNSSQTTTLRSSSSDFFTKLDSAPENGISLKPLKPIPTGSRFPPGPHKHGRRSLSMSLGTDLYASRLSKQPRSNSVRASSLFLDNDDRFFQENFDPNEKFSEIEQIKPRKKIRSRHRSLLHGGEDFMSQIPFELEESMGSLDGECCDPPDLLRANTTSSRKRLVCGSPAFHEMDFGNNSAQSLPTVVSYQHPRSLSCDPNSASLKRAASVVELQHPDPLEEAFPRACSSSLRRVSVFDSDCESDADSRSIATASESSVPNNDQIHSSKVDLEKKAVLRAYDDLEYMVKELSSEAKNKNSHIFGEKSWSITIPRDWSSDRRYRFLAWSQTLGFTVRGMGQCFSFLSITPARGRDVLNDLLHEMDQFKDEEGPQHATFEKDTLSPTFESVQLSTKKHSQLKHDLIDDDASVGLEICFSSLTVNDRENVLTSRELESLALVDKQQDTFTANVGTTERLLITQTGKNDPRQDMLAGSNHSHCLQDTSLLSIEAAISTNDLVLNIGCSPQEYSSRKSSFNSSRSLQNPARVTCSALTSIQFDHLLPTPVHTSSVCYDFIETPLPAKELSWGSRPIEGLDWGNSKQCDFLVLCDMEDQLEFTSSMMLDEDECENDTSFSESQQTCTEHTSPEELDVDDSIVNDDFKPFCDNTRLSKRYAKSMGKRYRMSLWRASLQTTEVPSRTKKGFFNERRRLGSYLPCAKSSHIGTLLDQFQFPSAEEACHTDQSRPCVDQAFNDEGILSCIISYIDQKSRYSSISILNKKWADALTMTERSEICAYFNQEDDFSISHNVFFAKSWQDQHTLLPWARFLSEGTFKQVYKAYNSHVGSEEAVAVMDLNSICDKRTVVAELVVSVLLSSLSRRGICPNFISLHGIYSSDYPPPPGRWGNSAKPMPNNSCYNSRKFKTIPKEPRQSHPNRYVITRMELCEGDAEEFIRKQSDQCISPFLARAVVFQIAFALHVAADCFSMKHYDIKLLNIFLKKISSDESSSQVVLRYGVGRHVFALKMANQEAMLAKIADYGTANMEGDTNGQPVTIAQITTQENTPPEFLLLGDSAVQGHGHDNFGLGLCMLHLFTGSAPYEEILEDVVCPPNLKKKLKKIWEDESAVGYTVVQTCILSDVYKDEAGHVIEGEPDEVLYDTLYRYLVLFGIPKPYENNKYPLVWKAISEALEGTSTAKNGKKTVRPKNIDADQFAADRSKFSISYGSNIHITRARKTLESFNGGMDLLLRLCEFDPHKRATAIDVINSEFMSPLKEGPQTKYSNATKIYSYTAFSTQA